MKQEIENIMKNKYRYGSWILFTS